MQIRGQSLAHILLCWEFGANRGHAVRLTALADMLRRRGHRTSFALQRIDAITPAAAGGSAIWQAPLSPRLLVTVAQGAAGQVRSLADILARLGFDDARIVGAMLRGWQTLFDAIRPDIVIGDFAPSMLLASRRRIPSIVVGTGFSLPPAQLPQFPPLLGNMPAEDARLTDAINDALAETGLDGIDRLPAIFCATRAIPASFPQFDPYARWRDEPLASPLVAAPHRSDGEGKEVFAYVPAALGIDTAFWAGLAASGLPVRAHVPGSDAHYRARLAALGISAEAQPVAFERIAQRSRMVVSHGSHGFACSALAAGLPQFVCPISLERHLIAGAVTRHRIGASIPMHKVEAAPFAAALNALYRDGDVASHAQRAARKLSAAEHPGIADKVEEALADLLG